MARLDARLEHNTAQPLALAFSGGGDSMALLEIATRWARRSNRRLLTITIDHGLTSVSRDWSLFCARAAGTAGADWVERRWSGDRPRTGVPAKARRARHALIADAAREAGARVVLFAHTADDAAESDWMRARGSSLGVLKEWSPSPAWPEGRGLMLFRPMLGERRDGLRDLLRGVGMPWIEDPANAGFARGEARRVLNARTHQQADDRTVPTGSDTDAGHGETQAAGLPPKGQGLMDRGASVPLLLGEGFEGAGHVAVTLLCAAGHDRRPRADRLSALQARLDAGEPFIATLAGARVEAGETRVTVTREAGELRRVPLAPLCLPAGSPVVWDGRYEISAGVDGWSVVPALGRLSGLSDADRAIAALTPSAARGTLPVLIRAGSATPVLAWRQARVRALAPRRLSLAAGETTQESDLDRTIHGETLPADLL